jgi:hypothetical protein
MIGIYIRLKVDGKRTFRAAPIEPGDFEYWLKSTYDGRQKWHRVGRYDGVKKAKLLLEREQERKEAARKYGLVAPPSIGHVTGSGRQHFDHVQQLNWLDRFNDVNDSPHVVTGLVVFWLILRC